jgi:hypothetical protein
LRWQKGDLGGAPAPGPELVARKADHHQPAGAVGFVELLQAGVLGREAAVAGGIDDQQHLAGKVGEAQRRAASASKA